MRSVRARPRRAPADAVLLRRTRVLAHRAHGACGPSRGPVGARGRPPFPAVVHDDPRGGAMMTRIPLLPAVAVLTLLASGASAQQSSIVAGDTLRWPTGTFSILAMDPATGEMGGAVQSRVFSVGNGVLWAEAAVGGAAGRRRHAGPAVGRPAHHEHEAALRHLAAQRRHPAAAGGRQSGAHRGVAPAGGAPGGGAEAAGLLAGGPTRRRSRTRPRTRRRRCAVRTGRAGGDGIALPAPVGVPTDPGGLLRDLGTACLGQLPGPCGPTLLASHAAEEPCGLLPRRHVAIVWLGVGLGVGQRMDGGIGGPVAVLRRA
jgi:hypothetical protein